MALDLMCMHRGDMLSGRCHILPVPHAFVAHFAIAGGCPDH